MPAGLISVRGDLREGGHYLLAFAFLQLQNFLGVLGTVTGN